jgi:hypothetical protein
MTAHPSWTPFDWSDKTVTPAQRRTPCASCQDGLRRTVEPHASTH